MNKKIILVLLFIAVYAVGYAQTVYTIENVIAKALNESPAAKQNETQKEVSYWQYVTYKGGYYPILRLQSNNSNLYTKTFSPVTQPDGTIAYRQVNQTNPALLLGLVQPIRWTNGTISANTSLSYFNNIITDQSQWSGNVMNIQLSQPIFSFNPLKWNKRVQPIIYEESKRNFAQQKEAISREALSRFFDFLTAQVNLQIATFNKANNDTIYRIAEGRYNIGTVGKVDLLQVELQKLRSEQDVASANLDLQTARLRLRSYIGINDGATVFTVVLPDGIPQFVVTLEQAIEYAKQNRSEYIAFTRQRIQADQGVAQAKGSIYQTTITATYGLNKADPVLQEVYNNPVSQQVVNISLNVPLVTWGRNRATVESALATKQLNDYTIAQNEVNFEQEIITLVRRFETLRLQIDITKKSDEVALERYNVAQNRYLIGRIDVTNLNIALTEKDNARRSYIQALQDFWTAYYDLRRLTLYDFEAQKTLYTPEP
jgi:outer membrane protein TolC